MSHGSLKHGLVGILVVLMAAFGSLAYGQGGATTSSLSGVVVDSSGGVIPGADVVVKNNATGGAFNAVSDANGAFTVPSLNPGVYTVTVTLMGFKSVNMPDVQLIAAQPVRVKAVMEVGQLQETVTVTGAAEIVQAESSAVATTLSTKQITTVPLATRNTLDFVAALPGVNTTGNIRNSSVMGLQPSAVNITIDGVNVQDNYLKSDAGNSFFARINPRMDAVEEVTVSTANPGAESAGQGAVQIRFVTRSGTNKFQGSGYWYVRRTAFNSNYWFNTRDGLPKDEVKVDTYGGRLGGPIKKDRLFFFFNYEEFRQPGTQSRSRTMLTAEASQGIFKWNGGPAAGVNLLALAAAKGQTSTADPLTAKLLADLQAAAGKGTLNTTGNPITQTLNFFNGYDQVRRYPTTRIDYNVTNSHRVGVSYYLQQYRSQPDTLNTYDSRFPGFPGALGQNSDRYSWMANWRWTISANMVSEVRGGITGGPVKFGDGITRDVFNTDQFSGWNGFAPYPSTSLISQMFTGLSGNIRDAPTRVLEDTVNWQKGRHGVTFGVSFTQIDLDYKNVLNPSPYLSMGVDANDPAYGMFSTANFPGASTTDLGNARNLYALLTGRVTAITGSAYLDGGTGNYVYLGNAHQQAHEREFGFFAQDSWRIRPDLTMTYGLRYELQMPFIMDNAYFSRPLDYCNSFGKSGCAAGTLNANLFAPGSFGASTSTQLRGFAQGEASYVTPKKNWAPSLGAAWRPHITGGFLERLLSADPVIRGGYSKAYTREGIYAVTALYGANPGGSVTASRNMSLGNLVTNTSQLPLLIRNGFSQFGPGAFPETPAYPLTPTTANSVNEFYPDSKTPYAHTFNVSFQRALTKNMAVDVRYVGTRNYGGWFIGGRNLNEFNTVENGFLNEFKVAQANLKANQVAGKGNSFAYTGAAGTAPLPIMLAWLQGSNAASNAGAYTGSLWTNSTLLGYLSRMNSAPQSMAAYLQTNSATYAANAAKAGLPANFFIINPDVSTGGAWVTGRPEDSRNNRYDSIQVELRRRMSGGFLVQGSYQYVIRSEATSFYTVRLPGEYNQTAVAKHAVKANWAYELPFGQGRKWASGVGRLGQILVGGWSIDGNVRIQSGNILDFGNVRLVGMTDAELQKEFKLRFATEADGKVYPYMLPDDIIQNTIKAYSTDPTSASGYGALGAPSGRYFAPVNTADPNANPTGCISGYPTQCTGNQALHHYVTGPAFFRADMSFGKRVDLTRRVWADIRVDVLNVLNNVDFFGQTWSTTPATQSSYYRVSSAYRDSSNTQDPGGRLMQLSFRVSF